MNGRIPPLSVFVSRSVFFFLSLFVSPSVPVFLSLCFFLHTHIHHTHTHTHAHTHARTHARTHTHAHTHTHTHTRNTHTHARSRARSRTHRNREEASTTKLTISCRFIRIPSSSSSSIEGNLAPAHFGKIGTPYLEKLQQAKEQRYLFLSV